MTARSADMAHVALSCCTDGYMFAVQSLVLLHAPWVVNKHAMHMQVLLHHGRYSG